MRLDVQCMRYLTRDDYRVLTAIEMTMRNHEVSSIPLITNVAKLRHGGIHKILSTLLRYKLLAHTNNEYDGYRLSYLGYDILALHALLSRGVVHSVGNKIGVGKESDIYEAQDEEGNDMVIKIHRLGRTSFRSVRKNRDYLQGKSKASWLYMSRIAATKEFAFMRALYTYGYPTPIPIDQSRHIVVMSRVAGCPMSQLAVAQMDNAAEAVFNNCIDIMTRLAQHGLVHCDFNEFNLMVDPAFNITLIDFPQMISTSHPNATELFNRDMQCLVKFFAMKMRYIPDESTVPKLEDIVPSDIHIDEEVKLSTNATVNRDDNNALLEYILQSRVTGAIDENAHGGVDDSEEGFDSSNDDDDDPSNVSSSQQTDQNVDATDQHYNRKLAAPTSVADDAATDATVFAFDKTNTNNAASINNNINNNYTDKYNENNNNDNEEDSTSTGSVADDDDAFELGSVNPSGNLNSTMIKVKLDNDAFIQQRLFEAKEKIKRLVLVALLA